MGQCFLYGNGGAALNFAVKRYESEGQLQTDTPQENTIGVVTETAFQEYAFSADQPGLIYKDVELITESVTLGTGFISANGTISAQTSANPELYTETYIPVKYGETYQYKYTVSASKSMYLSITEYTGSYTFKQRLVPVSSVTGTEQTGTYTPSESGITAVRLSWRTFPSTTYTMSFIHKNEAADDGTASEGMIWIVTGTAGRAAFNALRRNTVMVYPNSVKQYTGGIWKYVSAKVYQNGAWAMMGTLYSKGIFSVEHTEKVVNGAIQYGDTAFTVSTKSGNLVGEAYAVLGPVPLERVSTVTMKAKKTDTMASTNLVLMAAQSDSTNRDGAAVKTEQSVTDAAEHTVSLDVSGCSGDGWYIYAGTNTGGVKLANARTVDVMEVTLA